MSDKPEDDESKQDKTDGDPPKAKEPDASASGSRRIKAPALDAGWDALLGGKPSAPGASKPKSTSKPLFVPPVSKPKDSKGSPAVAGAFAVPAKKKAEVEKKAEAAKEEKKAEAKEETKAEAAKEEKKAEAKEETKAEVKEEEKAEAAKEETKAEAKEEEKAEAEEETKSEAEEEEAEADEQTEPETSGLEDDLVVSTKETPIEPAANEAPPKGPNWGVIALVAIGVIAAIAFVFGGGDESEKAAANKSAPKANIDKQAGDAKRNDGQKAKPPDKARTKAGDPQLEALRDRPGESEGTGDPEPSDEGEAGASEEGEEPAPEGDEGGELAPIPTTKKVDDPRAPSVIPPGTPEENAKAFAKLPVSIHDGPPIGAIGSNGIHVDEVAMGADYDGDCVGKSQSFSIEGDKQANVCFRVVHPREEESVRVYWEKDGKVTRRQLVKIRPIHAYKTRAFLKLRPEYVGAWKVRIVPEGEKDTTLAAVDFEVVE